ncbi:hypothetical protein ACIPPJ_33405 [Streptomyces sp. NPDC086091]|uniref:hypothetical protein n=1 Tax=Streptomyces sp. NPDC086091 TaxID=3365751 RepID=UPI0038144BFA
MTTYRTTSGLAKKLAFPGFLVGMLALTACAGGSGGTTAAQPAQGKASVGAAAPSGSSRSGHEVLVQAASQMSEARSLSLRYSSVKKAVEEKIDVRINSSGDCTGDYDKEGSGFSLIKSGERILLKPNDKYWITVGGDTTGEVRAALDGRWLVMDGNDKQYKDVAALCDIDRFMKLITDDSLKAVTGDVVTIDGQRAIPVREEKGQEVTTGYVAAEGDPRIIRIENSDNKEKTTISFSDFNAPVNVEEPPASETVTLEELAKRQ